MLISNDGKTHINIYSKAKTELGRWMSNFALTSLTINGVNFQSIEAYWYWLGLNFFNHKEEETSLREASGFMAKSLGREYRKDIPQRKDPHFEEKIKEALRTKLNHYPKMKVLLGESTLPFAHYYTFGEKTKDAGFKWLIEEWELLRRELQREEPLAAGESMTKYYCGIGSRKSPQKVLEKMTRIALRLQKGGYILRSGGAKGADLAFEEGANDKKEIFYAKDCEPWCLEEANLHLPKGYSSIYRMKPYVQQLIGRNMKQVLGDKGTSPVDFIVCWTEDGSASGGTGYAIRCGTNHNIPIYNLKNLSAQKALLRLLEEKNI